MVSVMRLFNYFKQFISYIIFIELFFIMLFFLYRINLMKKHIAIIFLLGLVTKFIH